MRSLRKVLIMVIALAVMSMGMTINVMADETTQLSSMTVYAVDANGTKTTVPMTFDSETYDYEITIMSDAVEIEIEAEVADETSTWVVDKDGINTKMDTGRNYTAVIVTSATGATGKYEINTTKLTAEEEATYEGETGAVTTEGDTTIKVGKQSFTIASTIPESEIPEGFVEDVASYEDVEYPCIKGETKDLTAFYLFNEETNGFYIYDGAKFYEMNNIMIKSRMYTVVEPSEVDSFLDAYDKETVTVIDQEVSVWVLDAEENMYLVYAMNWNGDTDLYCYDDQEKCFQRYLTSANLQSQMEAANTAYENLLDKYNNLVDKYNLFIKILCGCGILIVILIFVIINLKINKKAKKLKGQIEGKSEEEEEEPVKKGAKMSFVGKPSDRPYGDEVTFGVDEDEEGFYGGEIEDEDEVFIDITEDDIEDVVEEDVPEVNVAEEQIEEIEENLKETLKSMLPKDEDEEDEDIDVDFEFIDLD